jgi:hypothetical protein
MSYRIEWYPNELFFEHNGVRIFHTYKNDDVVTRTYHFGTANDTSDDEEDTNFDVRELPNWKEPEKPPYILADTDPKNAVAIRIAWTKYYDDKIEEKAIHNAIIAAIDAGYLADYILAAQDRPKNIPCDFLHDQRTTQNHPVNNSLSDATPGEWEIDTSSTNSISIWADAERDNGILLATVHLEAGQDHAQANAKLMVHGKEMAAALIGCRNAMIESGLWSSDEPFMEKIDLILDKVLFD